MSPTQAAVRHPGRCRSHHGGLSWPGGPCDGWAASCPVPGTMIKPAVFCYFSVVKMFSHFAAKSRVTVAVEVISAINHSFEAHIKIEYSSEENTSAVCATILYNLG